MAAEVLTREIGMRDGILPTGKYVTVEPVPQSSMFRIKMNGSGTLPQQYHGLFTSKMAAAKERDRYVAEFWDMSDSVKTKRTA